MAGATPEDARWMAEALVLAERGRYTTSPNPMVGAVIVAEGQVVGRGFHARAGEPHAEVFACREAGQRSAGATLYVTLEPCCHHGRTPPCSDLAIAAGFRRVVVAARDPNPRVAGQGIAALRSAGIEVVEGVLSTESERLNRPFNRWITEGRPWVQLKLATSLDGRIAAPTGASQWITGPEARAQGHALRAAADAIMVGSGTALTDDPRLNVRDVASLLADDAPIPDPRRVIIDSRCRLPVTARCLAPSQGPPTLIATASPERSPAAQALTAAGAEVCSLPDGTGRVDLNALLARLGANTTPPVMSVLVEGGGGLAAALIDADLVDELRLFVAPNLLGGDGLAAIAGLGLSHPDDATRWSIEDVTRYGEDLGITATRARS